MINRTYGLRGSSRWPILWRRCVGKGFPTYDLCKKFAGHRTRSALRCSNSQLAIRNSQFKQTGFTLIELIVVIIVVSTLATVATERLLYYQERAEKAVVDYTLEAVKMGLRIRMAELIAANRTAELPQLGRENPMRWMAEPPPGYAGEYLKPGRPGSWYFASREHELVYVPNNRSYLEFTVPRDDKELRFQVDLRYETNPAGGEAIVGITLLPTRHYKWF